MYLRILLYIRKFFLELTLGTKYKPIGQQNTTINDTILYVLLYYQRYIRFHVPIRPLLQFIRQSL